MQTQGAQVEFSQVGLTYDDGPACADLTFKIEGGDSIALIGPSGCGKSTTLHMLAGLQAPTTGTVSVNGQPVERPRRETAFIPQDLGLFPWKTVLQNAMMPLVFRKAPRQEATERARDALAQVGLAGREQSWPRELSGGQRQRLALARALATDADLLLMDEPLSAVDALLRESLQDTLLDLWMRRHHTQLFVTHSIEEAVYLGKRILVFSDRPGTVIADICNPQAGDPDWRDTPDFAARTNEVRAALERGKALRRSNESGDGSAPARRSPSSEGGRAVPSSKDAEGEAAR